MCCPSNWTTKHLKGYCIKKFSRDPSMRRKQSYWSNGNILNWPMAAKHLVPGLAYQFNNCCKRRALVFVDNLLPRTHVYNRESSSCCILKNVSHTHCTIHRSKRLNDLRQLGVRKQCVVWGDRHRRVSNKIWIWI